MRNPRQHVALEVYQLVLAVFLFVSPWLFAFAHGTLRIDTWVSAALVAAISATALIVFREWEEWIACILGPVDRSVAMGVRLPAHAGDVHQPLCRDLDYVRGAAGALADPLRFVFGKRERLASSRLHGPKGSSADGESSLFRFSGWLGREARINLRRRQIEPREGYEN
jgi:hypothetical protein